MVVTPLYLLNYFCRPIAISIVTDGDSTGEVLESWSY